MAMSRKHYVEIARRLKAAQQVVKAEPLSGAMALDDLTQHLADFFKRDNPRFEEARFRRAAGLPD